MSEFKPENVSQDAWDAARNFLSEGFTVPIGDRLSEVIELATYINNLQEYEYDMVTWEEFSDIRDMGGDVSEALFERAKEYHKDGSFDFVVYDPLDDENGFMLVGNDAMSIAKEACDYIAACGPEDGPLSEDKLAMAEVEGFPV